MEEKIYESKKEDNLFKAFLISQLYFFKLIFKERPNSFVLFGILVLLGSLIPPLLVIVNKETINRISVLNGDNEALPIVMGLLVLFTMLTLSQEIFRETEQYIFSKISYTVNYVLKIILSNKLIMIPLKEYEDSIFYDSINLANSAISGNGISVIRNLIDIIGSLISMGLLFSILLTIHWSMPVALFLSTLPGIIFIFISKFKSFNMEREISAKERELNYTDGLFIDKKSLREIRIYNLGFHLLDKWKNLFKSTEKKKLQLGLWELKTNSIALFILQTANLGVSLFLVYQIFGNNLSIGDYIALTTAVTTVQGLFAIIGASLGNIFETAIYNNALLSILNYEETESEKEISPLMKLDTIESIHIENGSFSYPNSDLKILDNINLKINKGDKISIVGDNGSGKTTLVYCLLGLYDLNEGSLKINDVPIKDINKKSFFKKVSTIFQDFIKYKYSVRENIAYGDLDKLNNDHQIINELKKIALDEKIESMSSGLDTYLTKEVPGGNELSGGEWQRIALARAFLKNADLIILDEPTAALDPLTELKVFELFHKLSSKNTTLTISHRIGPTRLSDYIIVMEKGKIVEKGTFNELIANRANFYEMYEAQSVWYKDVEIKQ